ncbi:hypothetical protein ASPZODRAFT_148724 [Penicilliopsis zonata CBS 506.65]|uniref:Peroxin/Ferlin domain-containing protein n=1 Tax=Penicilliopsis zonata CBS 506.65 TaxID=1073090 RepID=A0A1L9SW93_9EURO|nr:hypothetical protein ASPZODRAFT_148724 [Penicilliopsis zonata CBS 506.65]OJJ51446.1 hypothetical protein ASPZODRAFT_148724 [Penicilliopsis zonata CBS 506.65]
MENRASITLVDNTDPGQQPTGDELALSASAVERSSFTKRLGRASYQQRKYAKWQPGKLGGTKQTGAAGDSSQRQNSLATEAETAHTRDGNNQAVEATDFASLQDQEQRRARDAQMHEGESKPPLSELDVLYENQRGWFFFGIPLYSHSSLLNFDPSAWVTRDLKDSAVNIMNAQLPDPSWEWVWKTWYVDMSGDIDEQGWQYAFSFASSSWHGTHPWFHSFVRRRRWVRLRAKRTSKTNGRERSEFEMAHRLNEDYFTIHSKAKTRDSSVGPVSRVTSALRDTNIEDEVVLEDVTNIPSLMHALKAAAVDREKLEVLRRFIEEGDEELHYLAETIPDIMMLFVFQTSRYQFSTYMASVRDQLSEKATDTQGIEAEKLSRKQENLARAVETAKHHVTGPDIFSDAKGESGTSMLDLISVQNSARSRRESRLHHHNPIKVSSALMFSRGRPCLRHHGLSAVLDNATVGSEEPLLFLYPRWFTTGSRYGYARPITSIAPPPPSSSSDTRKCQGSESVEGNNSKEGVLSLNHESRARSARDSPNSTRVQTPATKGVRRTHDIQTEKSDASTTHIRPFIETEPPGPEDKTAGSPGSRRRSLVGIKRMSITERRRLRYHIYVSQCERERGLKQKLVPWAEAMDLLEKMQQRDHAWTKKGSKFSKEIRIPEETVALLGGLTAIEENVWYVPVHNGCRVHVLSPQESDDMNRRVILSGSERVVELVESRILQAQKSQEMGDPLVEFRKPPVPVVPSSEALARNNVPMPLIRSVWTHDHYSHKTTMHELPPDLTMRSVKDLAEFVDDLTRAQIPSGFIKAQGVESAQDFIVRTIKIVLLLDANQKLISTGALNRALSYLCDNEFLSTARRIFSRAEHVATTDTFNILLESASKRQDLQVFFRFLTAMSRLNIKPNGRTWMAFVNMTVSSKVRQSLLMYVTSKGYLAGVHDLRSAHHSAIQQEFLAHLEDGGSVDAFVDAMAQSQYLNWFNGTLVNQMFGVAARLKDFSVLQRLREICDERRVPVDSSTLNHIIPAFRANIHSALRYVFWVMDRGSSQLHRETYERLFLIAFKNRCVNICRVLWRYACLHQAVTYKMKQCVLVSLSSNKPQAAKDIVDKLWKTGAGKTIVGLDLHRPTLQLPPSIMKDVPSEFSDNPVAYLASGFREQGAARDAQLRVAKALVHRDIQVGSSYRPEKPLRHVLEEASTMDLKWQNTPRPIQWMLQNAIPVPVKL